MSRGRKKAPRPDFRRRAGLSSGVGIRRDNNERRHLQSSADVHYIRSGFLLPGNTRAGHLREHPHDIPLGVANLGLDREPPSFGSFICASMFNRNKSCPSLMRGPARNDLRPLAHARPNRVIIPLPILAIGRIGDEVIEMPLRVSITESVLPNAMLSASRPVGSLMKRSDFDTVQVSGLTS